MSMKRSDDGSALVELIFVVLVLFGMLFALIDFALIEASDNAGTNAAREGARQGILAYDCADLHTGCTAPYTSLQAITAKVSQRLGGLVLGTPSVVVTCWDGTVTATTKNCDATSIIADVDLIEVDVTWTRIATSAYGTATTHTSKATMTIQGSGQGTHSSSCQVISSTVSPTQAQIAYGTSGSLTGSVTVTAQTNGLCQPLYITFSTGSTPDQLTPAAMVSDDSDVFTFTIPATGYNWVPGSYNLNLSEAGTYALSVSPAPVLTVSAAVACSITAASVGPSAVVLSGNTSPSMLSQAVTVSVTTSAGCTGVNIGFIADGSTSRTIAMSGSAPNYTVSIPAAAYSWTVGSKNFSFTDVNLSPMSPPASVILQVALRCAISVSLSPTTLTVKKGKYPALNITATQTAGADCSGLTVTYAYATNSSASASMVQSAGVYTYTIPLGTNWSKGSWSMTFLSNNAPSVTTSPSPVQVVVN